MASWGPVVIATQFQEKSGFFLAASFAASIWESENSSCAFPGSVTNNEDSSFGTYFTKIEAEGEPSSFFLQTCGLQHHPGGAASSERLGSDNSIDTRFVEETEDILA